MARPGVPADFAYWVRMHRTLPRTAFPHFTPTLDRYIVKTLDEVGLAVPVPRGSTAQYPRERKRMNRAKEG